MGGVAILEAVGRSGDDGDRHLHHRANGGPHSDTFMGRPFSCGAEGAPVRGRASGAERASGMGRASGAWGESATASPTGSRAATASWAAQRAAAAVSAVEALDGTLPGQPLACCLRRERGWVRAGPLSAEERRTVVFTVRGMHFAAALSREATALPQEATFPDAIVPDAASAFPGAPTTVAGAGPPPRLASLARDLGDLIAGRPGRRFRAVGGRNGPPAAAVAVCLDVLGREEARHAHRLCWGRDGGGVVGRRTGGPWLGVVATPEAELVTTCHAAVDGFGHLLLTDRILGTATPLGRSGGASGAWASGGRAGGGRTSGRRASDGRAGASEGRAGVSDGRAASGGYGEAQPATGLAWRFLPDGTLRFREQAYATGVALERFYGRGGHALANRRHTPSFVVPIAPGAPDDPERARRRVVHGVLSVRRDGASFESFDSFSRRLASWLTAERAGRGLLTRTSTAVARAPLPRRLKQLCLSSHHGARGPIPPVEALSGRARLSLIRMPAGLGPAPPLIAASLPTLLPTDDDPRGSVTLTLVHHARGVTVAAFGVGLAGTDSGAEDFLELWLEALTEVPNRSSPGGSRYIAKSART